jgi:hypothetical protein
MLARNYVPAKIFSLGTLFLTATSTGAIIFENQLLEKRFPVEIRATK